MKSSSLREYRCVCGKLLFKGMLVMGSVETKCNRCGAIILTQDLNEDVIGPHSFALLVDGKGEILNASKNAPAVLGYDSAELLSMRLEDLDQGKGQEERSRFKKKDGTLVAVSSRNKRIAVGTTPCSLVVVDIAL